ncbi:hypothetical protein [Allocoleopsis sp.]|uniref:hypothetical protein n=1 Tax=Allocoleopsis sp. TaxID=3088169 RepID=UPI002FD50420
MSRQTACQHRIAQLQPHPYGFFQRNSQKSRLEILGSLVFWVGLTLTKPAWSASQVGTAALPVSNTDQKGSVGVTAASKDAEIIPSHPKVLPPDVTGEAAQEWSQPVGEDGKRMLQQGEVEREEDALTPEALVRRHSDARSLNKETFSPSTIHGDWGLEEIGEGHCTPPSCASQSVSVSVNTPEARVGERNQRFSEQEAGAFVSREEFLNSNIEQGRNLPSLTSSFPASREAHALPLSSQAQSPIACSIAQQPLTPQSESLYSPMPSNIVVEAENLPTSELQPPPSANSSESQQPASGEDPELGKLRLRELPAPPTPSKPAVYLLGGVGYFRSNNIFSGIDPIDDGLVRAGLTLLATPSLGPQTSLLASVGGNIIRYSEQAQYDYDQLNFNLGIRQQIGSRTYGEVGWSNRQLFSQDSGDRFLNDHSLYLELGRRDVLAKQVTLDTFYQLRLSMANPSDRSQVINFVGASLGYTPIPPLEVALDYQFAFADFTQQERQDQYHQLLARLSYTLTPNSRAYLYGGHSFGDSSDPYIKFNGFVFGAGVNFNLTLF